MRSLLTPQWLLSHLLVLTMIVAMTALGFWQINRLDARQATNDEIRGAAEAPELPIEHVLGEPGSQDHRAVTVIGTYRTDLSFLVANRTFDTQPGSWLATPIELADGRLVAVGRGWVPRLWIAGKDPREVETPAGEVRISGRLFVSIDGGRIGSGTDELAEVSRMDLEVVEEAIGAELVDRWVQLELQAPAQVDLPVPVPPPVLSNGPHLSYAFQWFFFTLGTIVAYTLILRRRLQDLGHG